MRKRPGKGIRGADSESATKRARVYPSPHHTPPYCGLCRRHVVFNSWNFAATVSYCECCTWETSGDVTCYLWENAAEKFNVFGATFGYFVSVVSIDDTTKLLQLQLW